MHHVPLITCSFVFFVLIFNPTDAGKKLRTASGSLGSGYRRLDFCSGPDCRESEVESEDSDYEETDSLRQHQSSRNRNSVKRHYGSVVPTTYPHLHSRLRSDESVFTGGSTRSKRRFKSQPIDLDEDMADDDKISDQIRFTDRRRAVRYPEEEDYHQQQQSHQHQRTSKVIDLPRTHPGSQHSYPGSSEIPIPPVPPIDTSSVPLPNYDHRLPRSLEPDDQEHDFTADYHEMPSFGQMRRAYADRETSRTHGSGSRSSGKGGWSRSYWKKFPTVSQSTQQNFEAEIPASTSHRRPPVDQAATNADEVLESANGFDGFLEGMYGGNSGSVSRSSAKNNFPLTMDQLPLLDPKPALDPTLMDSFLKANQRLASLLAPESFNPNSFGDDNVQPSTSSSSSSDARSNSENSGPASLRSLVGLSLSRLFGTSRYNLNKNSNNNNNNNNDRAGDGNDFEEEESSNHESSCDSNDSSDSRNSYKIVEPPTTTDASSVTPSITIVSLNTTSYATANPFTSHVSSTSTMESSTLRTTKLRKRFGHVTSTAM